MKKKCYKAAVLLVSALTLTGCQKEQVETVSTEIQTEFEQMTRASPLETPTPMPTSTPKPTLSPTPTVPPQETSETNIMYETEEYETEEVIEIADYAEIIYIGDSRFCSLEMVSLYEDEIWECLTEGNYDWMINHAFPALEKKIGTGTEIIINLGLNDLKNETAYAAAINNQAQIWQKKGVDVYYVSVGPVSEESYISNQEIMDFNTYMYQNLGIPYIDMYNWLVENGYETIDGQTYTSTTDIAIYDYLNQTLGR